MFFKIIIQINNVYLNPVPYLRWSGQSSSEPRVTQCSVGCHPGGRVPLQAPPDEVEEQRVVAALEGRLQFPGAGRPPRLAPSRPATVQNGGSVRQGGGGTVPRVT